MRLSGGKRALAEVFIIRLHGRRLSERLVRAVVVAEALEFGQLDVQRAHAQLAVAGLVELAAAGRVGALHAAAMLGASGRQHEQGDAAPLAGGLELGRGLAAAVDLHRLEVERRLADQAVKESCGAGGGGARAGAHAAQLRDRADGLGLLDREAGLDGDAQVVDPDHLAGLSPAGTAAPAPGVAVELAPPLGLCSPVVERDGLGLAGAHQAGDHAPGGGLAGREAVLARQHGADLGAPPKRKAKARLAHQLELGGGPLAPPHPARAAAAVGQGADACSRRRRFQRQGVAREQPAAFRAVTCEAPSRRSSLNSASLSKRSAACGESSSRIASRRQNLRCGHSVCMAHSPAFRLLGFC